MKNTFTILMFDSLRGVIVLKEIPQDIDALN